MPAQRILYLSRWWPAPPDNGTRLRVWGQMQAIAATHEVTLLSFVEPGGRAEIDADLARLCRHVEAVVRKPYEPTSWRARTGYFSRKPRFLVDVFAPAMQRAIEREAPSHDAVVAGTPELAEYAPWYAGRPAILDELEVGGPAEALHRGSRADRLRAHLTWTKLVRHLARTLPRFAACTLASEIERDVAARAVPSYQGWEVVENAVDAAACAAVRADKRGDLIVFAGALDFPFNREAMEWFVERVLPLVRAAVPGVELAISGPLPQPPFLAPPGVHLTGWVEDVRALVASATVSIAPLQRGGGTRLKILEAMALGTPVVATSKGAEGLAAVHGEHLLIADDARVFASQVVRLLRQPALRQYLSQTAQALVRRRYDQGVVGPRFAALIDRVLDSAPTGRRAAG